MSRILNRLGMAVIAWLGVDSWLDGRGKKIAILDSDHTLRVVHHRMVIRSVWGSVRARVPWIENEPLLDEDGAGQAVAVHIDVSQQDPREVIESFNEWKTAVIDMATTMDVGDEMKMAFDQVLARNRDILEMAGVDILDETIMQTTLVICYILACQAARVGNIPGVHMSESAAIQMVNLAGEIEKGRFPPDMDNPWGEG